MKKLSKILLLSIAAYIPFISGCTLLSKLINKDASSENSSGSSSSEGSTSSNSSSSSSSGSSSSSSCSDSSSTSSSSGPSGPTKVTVPAHTLSDSNPPINVNSKGQQVNEQTWESFRNASDSKFANNYNFTYKAYSGGNLTLEAFTKNGYYIQSSGGRLYYERKSGSKFYEYISTNDGYLREETTLDLQSKYVYVIQHEIYVHMFDFENYEYDSDDGCYRYIDYGFGCGVKFQGGYLTYLYYAMGANYFEINLSFETTIDIPKSYYYE